MADIYLGISGAYYTLPQTRWSGGDVPENPVEISINIDRAQMLDGSVRYNFRNTHQRKWVLDFPECTAEELYEFETICAYNQNLVYQNNWYSATWYDVVVSSFQYHPLNPASTSANIKYCVQLTLEEVL